MSENIDNENKNIVQDNDVENINVKEIEERTSVMSGSVFDAVANLVNSKPVETQEKQENEPLQLYVSSDGKRMRNNGPGELVAICNKMTKDQLIEEVVKRSQMLDVAVQKATLNSWSTNDIAMYRKIFIEDYDTGYTEYAKYYNNNVQLIKKNKIEILDIIKKVPPPLSYCNANYGTNKFVTLAHQPGTDIILSKVYPYYDFYTPKVLLKDDTKVAGIQLTMQSREFPKIMNHYYGAPGTTQYAGDFANAEEKIRLTYAEKFSNCFSCLKTYNFLNDKVIYQRLQKLLDAINEYKAKFVSINVEYKFIFDLIIDQIAYFYIDKGLLPKADEIDTAVLTKALPVQTVYKLLCHTKEEAKEKVATLPRLAEFTLYPIDYYTGKQVINTVVAKLIEDGSLPQGIEAVKNMEKIQNETRPRLIFSSEITENRKRLLASSPLEKMMMIDNVDPEKLIDNIPSNIRNEDVQKVLDVNIQTGSTGVTKENTDRKTIEQNDLDIIV